ncbi:MAG: phosphate signaling complex protein PhoU [Oscillospiraceae bacterium]|jgi:phosphate transport system protein|nr:phosphate signaling complex protein PhoU [Oscillospiraceae bacterium]
MRSKFDEQLQELSNKLIEMGALTEHSISNAVEVLLTQNLELAAVVVKDERESDKKEREIETLCYDLLLRQQPVARDLRVISAALKMVTDMERIADQAEDIAEIAKYLAGRTFIKQPEDIAKMAKETKKMLKESIDSFVSRDLELARAVLEHDDVVDELFITIRSDLIALIRENPGNGEQALDLLMVAKYLERIGDHAANIAEWVIFMLTGMHKSGNIQE